MKVSEYLREWQLSGQVPEGASTELAFFAGWLVGSAREGMALNLDMGREMAIRVAEFIENQC